MELILALDAGTSSVRTLAFDPGARVLDIASRELTQHFPHAGWVEHDTCEIADLAIATLREVASRALEHGHRIAAVGITNQRETTVAFDRENGHVAHHALVWQDRRTASSCEQFEANGKGPLVREITGLVLDPYFSATKMRWLLDAGVLDAASAPSLCTIDSWLLWSLSGASDGGVFLTEPSNASRTMLMDLDTLDWSPTMTALFAIPTAMLADIRPSSTNFATISAEVVPELGGVPITGILGDQQAALFGQACFDAGIVKATYGTGAFILANAGDSSPGSVDGLLTSVAWDLGAFTGLGSPFWRAGARGSISGLSHSSRPAHVARALLEALAFQVRAITDAFQSGGVALRELRADGGAAAMDTMLQLQATNSRLEVVRSRSLEATARGAACVAGLEIGLWHSLEQLSALWESDARFTPKDPLFADLGYEAWLRACERS